MYFCTLRMCWTMVMMMCKQSRFPLCSDYDPQMIFVINMLLLVAGQYLTGFLIRSCLAPFVSLLFHPSSHCSPHIFNKYNMFGATADLLSQSVAGPVTQTWSQLQRKNDDVCLSRFEPLRWTASQMWYRPSVITETAVCHKLPAALMDNLLVDIVRGRNM